VKICILTAGKGSRIGTLCENINKALLPIGHTPIISKIIEKFDVNDTFVIGLGYKKEQIKSYLKIAHPERNFIFVNIKNYNGQGSGPGLSLLSCKKFLNEPFVFIPCDCNFLNKFENSSEKNWIGVSKVPINQTDQYCNVLVNHNKVIKIKDKKKCSKDYYTFTGLTHIKDHELFWKGLKREVLIQDERQISNGLQHMIDKSSLYVKDVHWQDMGTLKQFQDIQKKSKLKNIAKSNEFLYFINNKVIKFFDNEKIIDNKISKSKIKPTLFPKVKKINSNFYFYPFWDGDVFYKSGNEFAFEKLLKELYEKFWSKVNVKKHVIQNMCKKFYYEKTISRLNTFFELNSTYKFPKFINDEKISSLDKILKKIPWNDLYDGIPVFIHGDLNFSNILYNSKNKKFMLIDWRQDFVGQVKYGDLYYDLAKLYAGILMNFNHVINEDYVYNQNGNSVHFSMKKWKQRKIYQKKFNEFITNYGLDLKKIHILAGLTYLNMAPLHPEPINKLLITFGTQTILDGLNGYKS
jgi:NDP-sugar pyrophosphorylase family protein